MIKWCNNMEWVDVDYVNGLIERVVIYEDDRIKVRWKVGEKSSVDRGLM